MIGTGSILVVCTGNVCRSPYVERRLRSELVGTGIEVASAGTDALVGHDMEPGSRALLERVGADASGFEARRLSAVLVAEADLIITAGREHRAAAARFHPRAVGRVFTLRDLADLLDGVSPDSLSAGAVDELWVRRVGAAASRRRGMVPARQEGVDITDPMGRPLSVFEQMAEEVDLALVPVIAALKAVDERLSLRKPAPPG